MDKLDFKKERKTYGRKIYSTVSQDGKRGKLVGEEWVSIYPFEGLIRQIIGDPELIIDTTLNFIDFVICVCFLPKHRDRGYFIKIKLGEIHSFPALKPAANFTVIYRSSGFRKLQGDNRAILRLFGEKELE